ncbi:MAG TPA: amino acid permease, partial [Planctomycetota bacterium]|nr:amino acid permease [Planctomycetota bacterium]
AGAVPELATLGGERIALPAVGRHAGERLGGAGFGRAIETVLLLGAMVSMAGSCAGAMLAAPRYLFAMAEDGFAPRAIARTDARGTPVAAVVGFTALVCALIWSTTWLELVDVAVLFTVVQHASTTLAVWRLRSSVPTAGRFVAPGGALSPLLSLAAIAALAFLAEIPATHLAILAGVAGVGALVAVQSRARARTLDRPPA